MSVSIAIESPLQDDVRALVNSLNEFLLPLCPVEFQFKMTVEQMAGADTTVLVARAGDGKAVGMGSLKLHGDGVAEVKRMYTLPDVRGLRIGSLLLERLIGLAESSGVSRLVLETGTHPDMAPAWRLYERGGFSKCGVVLDYPDSEYSAFFERHLVIQGAA